MGYKNKHIIKIKVGSKFCLLQMWFCKIKIATRSTCSIAKILNYS